MTENPKYHISVMLSEAIEWLITDKKGVYVDCTFGEGGHSLEILKNTDQSESSVIGIDKDMEILKFGEKRLEDFSSRLTLFRGSFSDLDMILWGKGLKTVNGFLFDLGVSSYQLDFEERGFSFNSDGPLDMRMDTTSRNTAAQIVNKLDEKKLEQIIRDYGEERFARSISRKIIEKRPINTTFELVEAVRIAIPAKIRHGMKKHFATKTFQALRIYVNSELEELENGLEKSLLQVGKGGRIVVISFHSLEDRIVKNFFKQHGDAELKILTPKPLVPSEEEIKNNRRSRSAKMRVAEKI